VGDVVPVLSAEEVKAKKIAAMGEELGWLHYELYVQVEWLHGKWRQFQDLFGVSTERVELLNRVAPRLFWIVQRTLIDDVLLHIARLTDPPEQSGRKNLTLKSFVGLIGDPELQEEVEVLLNEVDRKADFARRHRNRRIAHQDLATLRNPQLEPLEPATRQKIKELLEAICFVMNRIEGRYEDSHTSYGTGYAGGGAEDLVRYLEEAVKAEEEKREKLLDSC